MRQGSKILLIVFSLVLFVLLAFIAWFLRKEKISVAVPSSVPTQEAQMGEVGEEVSSEISLEIVSPKDGSTVTIEALVLTGKTVAGAEVFVNDIATKADTQGNFTVKLTLDEGENIISVLANDENGNYSEKEITVNLNTE